MCRGTVMEAVVAYEVISSIAVMVLVLLALHFVMILLAAKIWQAATLPTSQPQQELTGIPPQQ